MKQIVKRGGHQEEFEGRKLYASVYAACTGLHIKPKEAETIAGCVVKEVQSSLKDQETMTSDKIFQEATRILHTYNPDAAYMYKTHRDIS